MGVSSVRMEQGSFGVSLDDGNASFEGFAQDEHEGDVGGGAGVRDEEDYYALLNVSREAVSECVDEEAVQQLLNHAMKQEQLRYHPDKSSPALSATAARILRAYRVLKDARLRAIYDALGVEGVEAAENSAGDETLNDPHVTPKELVRLVRQLKSLEEEEEALRFTRVQGGLSMTTNVHDALQPYTQLVDRRFVVDRLQLQQSVEAHVSDQLSVELEGNVFARSGMGQGAFNLGLRRRFASQAYVKATFGTQQLMFMAHTPLSECMFAEAMARFTGLSYYHGWDFALLLGRQLTQYTAASLTFRFGKSESVDVGLQRIGKENRTKGDIMASTDDLGVTFEHAHRVSTKTENKFSAGYSLSRGYSVSIGGEHKVSQRTALSLSVAFSELEGVILELGVSRGGFSFEFPFIINPAVEPISAVGAILVPSTLLFVFKHLVLDPAERYEVARLLARARRDRLQVTREKRAAVQTALEGLAANAKKKKDEEREANGLIILKAWYGNLLLLQPHEPHPDFPQFIDVSVQLQVMVDSNHHLHLTKHSKAGLPVFYDPCPLEDKQLYVRYQFLGELFEVMIDDDQPLDIPTRTHLIVNPHEFMWSADAQPSPLSS